MEKTYDVQGFVLWVLGQRNPLRNSANIGLTKRNMVEVCSAIESLKLYTFSSVQWQVLMRSEQARDNTDREPRELRVGERFTRIVFKPTQYHCMSSAIRQDELLPSRQDAYLLWVSNLLSPFFF